MSSVLKSVTMSRVANGLLTLHGRHSLAPVGFQRFVDADVSLYDRDV